MRPSTVSEKKITRRYKAKLAKAARKAFRARMWHFRRDPRNLTTEERQELEALFHQVPRLRLLYNLKVRFKQIFDRFTNRRNAERELVGFGLDAMDAFPELEPFVATFEHWQEAILNYFEAGQTSGPVEGINTKARVIIRRAYGVKAADTLWTRLILDLNRAQDIVIHTIDQIRDFVTGIRALFSGACT
jgi:transposase